MENKGQFQNGNQLYKIRSKDGRDALYTPEALLEKANEYFTWCDENPMQEEQIVKFKDHFEKANVSKLRVYTIYGFCNFADISVSTYQNYSKNADYIPTTTRIGQVIYSHKFDGAAGGFLRENLIIRDLKLKDTSEIEHSHRPSALNPAEAKMIQSGMADTYGSTPQPKTIDIEHEEIP